MILINSVVPPTFDLILAGDIHWGTKMCHRSGVEKLINRVNRKSTYMIFMGDAVDGITNTDKRWDIEVFDGTTPTEQAVEISSMFYPIRKRIIAWLTGNHERSVKGYGNIVRDIICDKLGVNYGTVSCRVQFNTIKYGSTLPMFRGFFHHGDGQIASSHPDPLVRKAMMTYKLKCKLEPFGGDCIINAMGHTHKMLIYNPTDEIFMEQNEKEIVANYTSRIESHIDVDGKNVNYINPYKRWYINTGGFEKLYAQVHASGYAEIAMYSPLELGYVVVKVVDGNIIKVYKEYV